MKTRTVGIFSFRPLLPRQSPAGRLDRNYWAGGGRSSYERMKSSESFGLGSWPGQNCAMAVDSEDALLDCVDRIYEIDRAAGALA